VPCAAVGLAAALTRRGTRAERSFGAMGTAVVLLLLAEATLYASNGAERFQERYLLAVPPLVPIAFFLGVRRLGSVRAVTAACAVAAGLLLVTMRVPLAGYTALNGEQDSPFLQAVAWLDAQASVAGSSLGVSAAAGILCVVAALAALRPRVGAPACFALALITVASCSLAATATDARSSDLARRTFGAETDQRWIDRFGERDVASLVTVGADRSAVHHQLFWNQSVTDVLRLPGSPEIDTFGYSPASVSPQGVVLERGRPVTRPLLVQEYYAVATLDEADLLQRTPAASLWKPHRVARLEALTVGRYLDGWVDREATITLFPRADGARTGHVTFVLSLPPGAARRSALTITAPGFRLDAVVTPEHPVPVSVPFSASTGPVEVRLHATEAFVSGLRVIAARMTVPEIATTTPGSSGDHALPIHTA
jgi:hypothetical protein